MDIVRSALNNNIIALHPGSSTIFIVEQLTGNFPNTDVWVSGMVAPKGTCRSAESEKQHRRRDTPYDGSNPAGYPHTWVVEQGRLQSNMPLGDILDRMGSGDVYIKGVNAVDPSNKVGVLIGSRVEGGTIALVMSQAKKQGFQLICPVGLEKLLPIFIEKAAKKAAKRNLLNYSMGMPCSLLPCEGVVVTEVIGLEILTGATAIPISAGGLGGAEGSVTMVIEGTDEQVTKAIEYVESVKGTQLPREIRVADCRACRNQLCSLRGGRKPWCC
jgi:hypothetical protein